MFELCDNSAVFREAVLENDLLDYWLETMNDIDAQTLADATAGYFEQFLNKSTSLRLGFSLWGNDQARRVGVLIAASGFKRRRQEYPIELPYGTGIVGAALEMWEHKQPFPHVSPDYSLDQQLYAADVVRSFGFESGIAFPLVFDGELRAVFKMYCSHIMAPSVKLDEKRLKLECSRLTHLVSLWHKKTTAIAWRLASLEFANLRDATTSADERKTIQRHTQNALQECLAFLNATRATLVVREEEFACANSAKTETIAYGAQDQVASPLEIGPTEIGQLTIYEKLDGTKFSSIERSVLNVVAKSLSRSVGRYLDLTDNVAGFERQVKRQSDIIQMSDRLLNRLAGPTIDSAVTYLLKGLKRFFSLHKVTFFVIRNKAIEPYSSEPKALATELSKRAYDGHLLEECRLHSKPDWSIEDCGTCQACDGLAKIGVLRRGHVSVSTADETALCLFLSEADAGTHREYAFPILIGSTVYGVVSLFRYGEHELSPDEVLFVRSLCNAMALGLRARHLREMMTQVNRDEVRNEMASDVLHYFGPQAVSLANFTALLERKLNEIRSSPGDKSTVKKGVETASGYLESIMDTVRQQNNVIQRYRSIWSRGEEDWEDVDLDGVFDDILELSSGQMRQKKIDIRRDSKGRSRPIRAVRIELYLIFWNLLHNAIKFTRGNRRTTISLTIEYDSKNVSVSIRDQGVGIKSEIRSRVWEPNFSTPAPGRGRETTGIGLVTVSELVKKIPGAEISFSSKLNRGTEFTVRIPYEPSSK